MYNNDMYDVGLYLDTDALNRSRDRIPHSLSNIAAADRDPACNIAGVITAVTTATQF